MLSNVEPRRTSCMPATIRTFIGIPIPSTPPLRDALKQLNRFGRSVKPTSPENLHLTLKFLGDTPRSQLNEIKKTIQLATANIPLHDIELTGLGAFPNVSRPSVAWIGLRPTDHLKHIAAELDRLLEPLGFTPETRPFHPHLTLAYVKGAASGLSEAIIEGRDLNFGTATISAVDLYQSELTPAGSRYTSLAKTVLAGAGR
jgi:RNA 2',3'-cyclic 3'-phosphodiesterase